MWTFIITVMFLATAVLAHHQINMRILAHRRITELESDISDLRSKADFHERDASHKRMLYDKSISLVQKLQSERDEARQVAERFREKYLRLKSEQYVK